MVSFPEGGSGDETSIAIEVHELDTCSQHCLVMEGESNFVREEGGPCCVHGHASLYMCGVRDPI